MERVKKYFPIVQEFYKKPEGLKDPSPPVDLPEKEYIEIYNRFDFDILTGGWKICSHTDIGKLAPDTLAPGDYAILCDPADVDTFAHYGTVIAVEDIPALTNSGRPLKLVSPQGKTIDSISYKKSWYKDSEKDDGGYSLERIDPANTCGRIYNWAASVSDSGGTPGKVNSIYADNIDTKKPELEKLIIEDSLHLRLEFSERLDAHTATQYEHYSFTSEGHTIDSVFCNEAQNIVSVKISLPFRDGREYKLKISNVADFCGNTIASAQRTFVYYHGKPYDLVINEIMADETPSVELPEYEYIELYNTSGLPVDISDWILSVNGSDVRLPSFTVKPDDYLVITEESACNAFTDSITCIEPDDYTSLVNSSGTLILRNDDRTVIDFVRYDDTWYENDFKTNGGWSLEKKDYNNVSGKQSNWGASENYNGGTPGYKNSIAGDNPDITAPEMTKGMYHDTASLKLVFSEAMDRQKFLNPNNYEVDRGFGNPDTITGNSPFYNTVYLKFSKSIQPGITYTLTLSENLTDLAGNNIAPETFTFTRPVMPLPGDIAINEILFNPYPGGHDFVELYNTSNKTLDLGQITIASKDNSGQVEDYEPAGESGSCFFPGTYRAFSVNPDKLAQQYLVENPDAIRQVDNLPTYANDKGRVAILNSEGRTLEDFAYNEGMHFELLTSNEGVSLERINYKKPVNNANNWHSAAESAGFATPGYENSQFKSLDDFEEQFTLEPKTFSPDQDGHEDVLNIRYKLDKPGYVANIDIYDANGRNVRHLVNNQLLETRGTFKWNGLDNNGKKVPIGIYIVYIELFNNEAKVKQLKKTCVVARKLD